MLYSLIIAACKSQNVEPVAQVEARTPHEPVFHGPTDIRMRLWQIKLDYQQKKAWPGRSLTVIEISSEALPHAQFPVGIFSS
jgi:hypothetical protein